MAPQWPCRRDRFPGGLTVESSSPVALEPVSCLSTASRHAQPLWPTDPPPVGPKQALSLINSGVQSRYLVFSDCHARGDNCVNFRVKTRQAHCLHVQYLFCICGHIHMYKLSEQLFGGMGSLYSANIGNSKKTMNYAACFILAHITSCQGSYFVEYTSFS